MLRCKQRVTPPQTTPNLSRRGRPRAAPATHLFDASAEHLVNILQQTGSAGGRRKLKHVPLERARRRRVDHVVFDRSETDADGQKTWLLNSADGQGSPRVVAKDLRGLLTAEGRRGLGRLPGIAEGR